MKRADHKALRIFLIVFGVISAGLYAEPRRQLADDVFKKWKSWQYLYDDQPLKQPVFVDRPLEVLMDDFPAEMQSRAGFLGLEAGDFTLSSADQKRRSEAETRFKKSMKEIIDELNHDMPAFIRRLEKSGFTSKEIDAAEKESGASKLGAIYRKTLVAPLSAAGQDSEEQLFGLANRMFEYAFGQKHGEKFQEILHHPERHPLARLFYANIWYRLSGNGWRIWHKDVLSLLREESKQGREVVYIAGGTDIYHLIRSGVYRIRVIDPILPSQTKYYSEGWQYLVDCSAGDEIRFVEERITLRRESCQKLGSFTTDELSDGQKYTIPSVIVTWRLIDDTGRVTGSVIYERRFATQNDFSGNKDRVLLISFNELAYVTDSGPAGWGMDSEKWPSDIRIYVKQLRQPVGKTECVNMKKAALAPFSFIRLGTSID
jgi:hypothetical protein